MRERPHHAHEHIGLTWREFVTTPWTGPRKLNDKQKIIRAGGDIESAIKRVGTTCICNFTWTEVVPCSVYDAIDVKGYAKYMYELNHDGSGRAYPSIINLRREKILNFLSVKYMKAVASFHPLRYEELTSKGTLGMIEALEDEE